MSKRVVRHNPNSARLPGTNQALLVRALTLAAAIVSRNPDAKVGSQPCGRSEVTKKTITWRSPKFTPASSKASSRAATPSSERSSTPARNLRARQVKKVQQALSSQKTIYQRKLERKRREKQLEATNPQLPSPPPTEPESEESTDNMLGYQKRAAMHTKLGTLERHNMYHGTIKVSPCRAVVTTTNAS